MILHHIQTSPGQDNALQTCLRYIQAGDTIILSGNGVNALLQTQWQSALSHIKVLLLQDDVQARGLTDMLQRYTFIDYGNFVELSLTHQKVISW